jgi:dihydroorotase
MATLTIRNGRVIDPANGVDQTTDITLERGKVTKVGKVSKPTGKVFDASGCIVSPGLIDPHVHLREPGQEDKETIATGTASAVNGGFTTVVCMANTAPAIDDDGRIDFIYWQAGRHANCNVYPTGAVTKGRAGEELAEIALMADAGAVAFTDDGDAIASASMMAKALTYVKMTGRCIMQHCEEPTLISDGAMNAGPLATRLGLAGRPAVAEDLIIQRDIMLNAKIGCAYHVQHMSTEGSVDLVRRARKSGQPITAEVTPHHLLLTEDACASYDPNYKMNPPLRTKRDIKALLKGVKDGTITVLGTDHAPHTREDKELEFAASPSGIIGLDCALPLYIKALIETDTIDWPTLIAMMTINPAALCLLDEQGKGSLGVGADADVTIIDPNERWEIDVSKFKSKSRNCPFDGWPVTGRAIATIVGGKFKLNRDKSRTK